MRNTSLLTIVTVCFNAVDEIEKTICSVISQHYSNIEYIVIDGGSSDGTIDLIKKYEENISFWISEPDKGIYDAMNKGILHATGEWINFMNAGDVFASTETVEKMAAYLSGENKVVYGNILKCFPNYKIRDKGLSMGRKLDAIDFIRNTIHHQSAFIRRDLFDIYGLYDTHYKLASDWKFFMQTVGLGGEKSLHVDIDVCLFAMDGVSTTGHDAYAHESDQIVRNIFGSFYPYACELAEYRVSLISRWVMYLRVRVREMGIGGKIKKILAYINTILQNKK